MKIFIADDHPIFRQGLLKIMEGDPELEIVGESGDGEEALQLIRSLCPDIAVLDISMPGMSGLEIVSEVQKESLKVEFIILTMFDEEEYFDEAMDSGVKGYLLKENATSDLLSCLKSVAQGKYYVSPSISEYLLNRNTRVKELNKSSPALSGLTQMEKKVLRLIADNKTSKEVAAELFISYRTVQNHRTNICNKLDLKGHHKLLQFALENKSLL
ncbi:MAG: response regulator transcription factor [Caldithrix sp.]|nr:MAG: response regulator transcription factor [Caldithrix sp.]TDJ01717.1 MAG: response regulator transcription factor [Caldithrix sp.]